jgi:hypothetical protein
MGDPMTDDLMAFLRARLDADTAAQNDTDDSWHDSSCGSVPSRWRSEAGDCDCGIPQRTLADIKAKRAILDVHVDRGECTRCEWFDGELYPCETLRLLALPYAEHPNYRKEWTP